MKLAARLSLIKPSPTLAITARAKALKAQGVDVISFGAGEPDFDTPRAACEAAMRALREGKTRYIDVPGLPELRAAIAADYTERRGRAVKASEVIVSTGGKQALFNAALAVFGPGDRVIVPGPYWVSYPEQLVLAEAEPVFVSCDAQTDFKLTAAMLADALKTHQGITGLVLCSPSNPTGAVYDANELEALAQVLREHPDVSVFFDAMYDRLYYDGEIAPDLVAVAPELASRVLTFNGFSKTYAMTGWRLGYAIGPEAIIKGLSALQSQSTSNATTFAQYGALAALKEVPDAEIDAMREAFRRRRDLIVAGLNAIPGVSCAMPGGAFYVFPDFSAHIGEGSARGFEDDLALAAYLLDEAKVALVPGSAFGAPGFMRLSYATSDALISAGLERLRDALS